MFDDGFEVWTIETNTAVGIFEFSRDFQLKAARWSDGYRESHDTLEREGRIRHPWEQCPDQYGPRLVRAWDPEHGWTEIHPTKNQTVLPNKWRSELVPMPQQNR